MAVVVEVGGAARVRTPGQQKLREVGCVHVPDECDPGPPITQHPADQVVDEGEFAFFQVAADGVLLEYQWRKDGVELTDTERIIGTQSSVLVIVEVHSGDAGEYDCMVTETIDPPGRGRSGR